MATTFLDRTIANLAAAWRGIAERTGLAERTLRDPDIAGDEAELLKEQLRDCLEAKGGEVSARARAAQLGRTFLTLSPEGTKRFLEILAKDFALDAEALVAAAGAYRTAIGTPGAIKAERRLRAATMAPRVKLLTQFTSLPDGVKFLVDMRAKLLDLIGDDPDLASLDEDMRSLLAAWFDIGFLELRRITWDSPASLLEKLAEYEAVHRVRSWADLKNRLDADRRFYAFFHPRMPTEPLIFVEVALVKGIADNVQRLLDPAAPQENPAEADTAIFYSISNTQEGLRGIGFGNFLIKQVVDDLASQFPRLSTFSTLSPIPGFRRWLARLSREQLDAFLPEEEREPLAALAEDADWRTLLDHPWMGDPDLAPALRPALMRLGAVYLFAEKRDGKPVDPVARFHLGNGASIERINWLGDSSAKGMKESAGLMVNYVYRLADIEENHEAFASGSPIAASSSVKKLAAGSPAVKAKS
ncbi:MAG: malonyl-CoA decarboxylase [Alphaproteobacteria bacterium]|nr:malonyl-CoA decarboxylase [Alphaproteobacteria bacterium]